MEPTDEGNIDFLEKRTYFLEKQHLVLYPFQTMLPFMVADIILGSEWLRPDFHFGALLPLTFLSENLFLPEANTEATLHRLHHVRKS
jgi:hypothetical protein